MLVNSCSQLLRHFSRLSPKRRVSTYENALYFLDRKRLLGRPAVLTVERLLAYAPVPWCHHVIPGRCTNTRRCATRVRTINSECFVFPATMLGLVTAPTLRGHRPARRYFRWWCRVGVVSDFINAGPSFPKVYTFLESGAHDLN